MREHKYTFIYFSTSAGGVLCWYGISAASRVFMAQQTCWSLPSVPLKTSGSLFVLSLHQRMCSTAVMQMFPRWLFAKGGSPAFVLCVSYTRRERRRCAWRCMLEQMGSCRQGTEKWNPGLKKKSAMYSSSGRRSAGIWISAPLHLHQQESGNKSYWNFPPYLCCFYTAFWYLSRFSGNSSDLFHVTYGWKCWEEVHDCINN